MRHTNHLAVQHAQLPHVAIVDAGDFLGATGGAGQIMRPMLGALGAALGERCTILTGLGHRVRDLDAVRPGRPLTRADRLRRRAIHRAQEHTPLPLLRLFAGAYDIYHHVGLSLRPRVPRDRLIVSVYDLGGERWPDEQPFPDWAGSALRRAAGIVTISRASRDELCSYYDQRRFHPTPAAADAQKVGSVMGDAPAPYLLCAGGQTRRKNVGKLIQAFARFRHGANPPHRLVVTGVDPSSAVGSAYRALARDCGVGDRVALPGYLPDDAMPSFYRRAEAVVVPSLYEGFGLPVLHAMACGTPVLSSDASSLPEVAGDAALLVDATSIDALAMGLTRITGDEGLRAALRRRGLDRAPTFTWERCARETIAVYERVAAEAAGVAPTTNRLRKGSGAL